MKVMGIEDEKILPAPLAINQALLDALPDLMFILNKDAVYLDCKAGGNGDLYRARNDFLGKRVDEVMPADFVQAVIEEEEMLLGGDIILKVGGIGLGAKFAGLEDIRDYLNKLKVGATMNVTVLRGGRVVNLSTKVNRETMN